MGTHISKIKSVALDSWTPEQIQTMIDWGNKRVNDKYMVTNVAPPSRHDSEMEKFIRNKYEKKLYMGGNGDGGSSSARASSSSSGAVTQSDLNNFAGQLRTLASMGFTDATKCVHALKQANASIDGAIEILVSGGDGGSSSSAPAPSRSSNTSKASPAASSSQSSQSNAKYQGAIATLRSMGFENDAENLSALKQSNGQVEAAINVLISRQSAGVSMQSPTSRQAPSPSVSFNLSKPPKKESSQHHQQQQQQKSSGISADVFGLDLLSISDQPAQASVPDNTRFNGFFPQQGFAGDAGQGLNNQQQQLLLQQQQQQQQQQQALMLQQQQQQALLLQQQQQALLLQQQQRQQQIQPNAFGGFQQTPSSQQQHQAQSNPFASLQQAPLQPAQQQRQLFQQLPGAGLQAALQPSSLLSQTSPQVPNAQLMQQQPQAVSKPQDPFAGLMTGTGISAQPKPQQQQQQQQAPAPIANIFGTLEPTKPAGVTNMNTNNNVNKDSIMSLFNTPTPQQQQQQLMMGMMMQQQQQQQGNVAMLMGPQGMVGAQQQIRGGVQGMNGNAYATFSPAMVGGMQGQNAAFGLQTPASVPRTVVPQAQMGGMQQFGQQQQQMQLPPQQQQQF
ncbi:hypothetical protein HDV05_007646 [Chytridiales sp. JEL 0842]|nr:hypothetical protein HDV05_007646 [Chytridiales sp. JEL 0842]